ncbi:MAG: hypothetical protein KGI73_01415 [Patescibacteria group bacterium]|nr:hypothetical protein [Patescibacteria group bacterium]
MNIQALSLAQALHHAYMVFGSEGNSREAVLATLEKRGVKATGNPDVFVRLFQELLVDNVRDELLPFAALKPIGEQKYLIVSFSRANDAAQNALLKAVEEGVGSTVFFFCVEPATRILPTLRSRCVAVSAGAAAAPAEQEDANAFLTEDYEERLARVEKMASYISKTQDRAPVRAFVGGLLTLAHEKHAPTQTLRDLLDADRYLRLQGSSVKSILGHLAVSLPRQ